jgi:hypothetical protein
MSTFKHTVPSYRKIDIELEELNPIYVLPVAQIDTNRHIIKLTRTVSRFKGLIHKKDVYPFTDFSTQSVI